LRAIAKNLFRLDTREFIGGDRDAATLQIEPHRISQILPARDVQPLPAAKHSIVGFRRLCRDQGDQKSGSREKD
jgi:hypothetical protein